MIPTNNMTSKDFVEACKAQGIKLVSAISVPKDRLFGQNILDALVIIQNYKQGRKT